MGTANLYTGVHPLYAIGAFVCAIIMMILITRVIYNRRYGNDGVYFYLFLWVLFFCLQDGFWGLCATHLISSDSLLFITSTVFHLCSAFTSFVWVCFHVSSLKDKIIHPMLIKIVAAFIVIIQIVLLICNCFTRVMFYIDENGEYTSTSYRKILFYFQFAVYISIGLVSMVKLIKTKATEESQDLTATFCMNISPIFFGFFQMLYPDAPANSIGFAISCIIFYTFIEANYERQITEYRARAEYQEIIERQNAELVEQSARLQQALAAEEEASRAKTAFLFNMSHDIRTPMNAIVGFTAMAKKRINEADKVSEYLDKIEVTEHQLLSLINQVLEMSRIESGKICLSEQPVNLKQFANEVKIVYEETARSQGIIFGIDISEIKHFDVIADVDRMKQIITNIIGNAIKYTSKGGSIDFSVRELEKTVDEKVKYVFTVKDTGIGISEDFRDHIFDVFAREESTTVNKIQGTGLGMSIVKRLTDIMNGEIDIQSKKGVGTTMSVTIPMTIDLSVKEQKDGSDEKLSIDGMSILLVDDNELNREIATELLEDEGAVIDIATDGTEAVEKVQKMYEGSAKYDCVLMDIQMPKMDGYEATQLIRSREPEGNHLPIIALSANAFEEDRQKSLSIGMDAHVSKPINMDELLLALAKSQKGMPSDLSK